MKRNINILTKLVKEDDMKLMKTILVGIISLTMMFAQQGQGSQEPPPEAKVFREAMQNSGGDLEAAYNAL